MNTENNLIAVEEFDVLLDGEHFDIRLELRSRGEESYGNGTYMVFFENDKKKDIFDTRYEKGCSSAENFKVWAWEWYTDYADKNCVITRKQS